jgi:hypothetical protein
MVGTVLNAGATPDAAIEPQREFRLSGNTLRIVAPPALKRASLQKNSRADARPVMDSIAADVENDAVLQTTPSASDFGGRQNPP